jgi:hypothetical protein
MASELSVAPTKLAKTMQSKPKIEDVARLAVCYAVGIMVRWISIFGAVLLLGSCTSPTLPLPPPEPPTDSAGTTPGTVHLTSINGAEANALILIINQNPAVPNDQKVGGTFADAAGTWDANVFATHGDVLNISQQFGAQMSAPISFTVTVK